MNELTIKGTVSVSEMIFHDIEGGFGKGKKAILAKDIADIHNRELKAINQAINLNRTRFNDGIDIVDLKSVNLIDPLLEAGIFNKQSVANANNIYILSERGYAKLLKILEDDIAWEQYDKLVDGYFNMRAEIKSVRKKAIDVIFKQNMNIAKVMTEFTGIKEGIAYAVAIRRTEELTGESLTGYKNLLPSIEAGVEIGTLNATAVGDKIGVNSRQANLLLLEHGLQYKDDKKNWRLTDEGKKYGEEFPYERNGHSDYRILWNESVIDIVGLPF